MSESNPLRLEYVVASTLGPNPANWRRHGEAQKGAIAQVIEQVGWAQPLLYNEFTNRLIDGHCRREMFLQESVPVLIGCWTEAQERTILATLDPLSMMADGDPEAFGKLLGTLDTTGGELMGLLSATAEMLGMYGGADATEAAPDDDESAPEAEPDAPDDSVPDTVFPSDNELGIPTLDLRLQATEPVYPVVKWRSQSTTAPMPGTWCFYVADFRFDALWRLPDSILPSGPACAVEPNFSTYAQMPMAYGIWQTYRKRWIARYWQTKGVRILVDLNVDPKFRELNLSGVPKGWRAYADRAHDGGDFLAANHARAVEHAGGPVTYLVYGGGKAVEDRCRDSGWLWIDEQFDPARIARKTANAKLKVKAKAKPNG